MSIELMSPAGSIDSFLEAMEKGADSVYLGLRKFNARKPAENFSIYNLKKVVNYAHQNNKKVYLTINIDIKSNELKEVAQILELAENINIDALIIKDPGIIYLINKFYKNKLILHFSTQNAICSSFGVDFARKINIKRVILARELELPEIKKACSISGIECEIFTEGSMCFSISGRCLMSSWVGGRSGNRGVCTGPCRVIWEEDNKKDTYFSMKDLSLISFVADLKRIGVSALKIEGRLKNALWVGKITDVYRKVIDKKIDSIEISHLLKELKNFSAREIDKGHIYKHDNLTSKNEEWQNYKGIKLDKSKNNNFYDNSEIYINSDRKYIKISIKLFEGNYEKKIKIPIKTSRAKLIDFNRIVEQLKNDELIIENKFKIKVENINIKLTSSFIQKVTNEILSQIRDIIRKEEKLPELSEDILNVINYKTEVIKKDRLLGDYPDKIIISSDHSLLFINNNLPIKTIVISLSNLINIKIVKKLKEKYQIILSIPSVLYEKEAEKMEDYIKELYINGFNDFEANSFSGVELLENIKCNKSLGLDMPIMNHLAARFFYDFGYSSVYTTLEGDKSIYHTLSNIIDGKVNILVFGKIKLFQSRVYSSFIKKGTIFKDKFGVEVEYHKENSLNIFVSKKSFSLVQERIKKEKIYFDSLTADLRYYQNPVKTLDLIFKNKLNENNFSTFNFYRKLV